MLIIFYDYSLITDSLKALQSNSGKSAVILFPGIALF